MLNDDEGPVYYREIQKNAYLRRIPEDETGSKLRPLGHKKSQPAALWSVLCVHNGRTPYIEQYASRAAAAAHTPLWRASLARATLVAPGLRANDFVLHAAKGPVRMRAGDWETMQDWVTTLRESLHELRILPKGENVYCAPPAAAPPRAAARDPTSPLPPTPPVPIDRVPGIEIAPTPRPEPQATTQLPTTHLPTTQLPTTHLPATQLSTTHLPETQPQEEIIIPDNPVDISNWDTLSQPSTSHDNHVKKVASQENKDTQSQNNPTKPQASTSEPNKSLAKICGQNICLDDSLFKRSDVTVNSDVDSDEEFFNEIDKFSESENMFIGEDHKQTLVVSDKENNSLENGDRPTNITVIQVSNKDAPHTAIPVFGSETDVFKFDFPQKAEQNFINIVNTETNAQNDYGTIFDKTQQYGHLSLTTTVNLTAPVSLTAVSLTDKSDGLYERLCLASTSNERASPNAVKKVKNMEKLRKSSLPNLDTESAYEYLYPDHNQNNNNGVTFNNSVNVTHGVNTPVNSVSNTQITPSLPTNSVSASVTPTRIPINRSISHNNTYVNCSSDRSAILDSSVSALRTAVERSHSQNSYDSHRRNLITQEPSKREEKTDKEPSHSKPMWKRGLTELSLLSKLRGFGRRSPARESPTDESSVVKVRSSRPSTRVDNARRRSSSLSNANGDAGPQTQLQPLRCRQAAALRAEQRRGAALVATVPVRDPPVFVDYSKQVWISWWSVGGVRCGGRAGDRVCGVRGVPPKNATHARGLMQTGLAADILFHRVPLGKIYVINKLEQEGLGIKLDSECNIISVDSDSPAQRAGLPPLGKWAITEVNNRPINLIKGGDDDMQRLSRYGTEVSLIIQPAALVKKLRASLKGNKSLLGLR